jgi:hypothetical protein
MVIDYSRWDNLSIYSSSSECASEAESSEDEGAPDGVQLPPALWAAVFALLPTDARARCAAVSRGWRDALRACPEVWAELWFDAADAARPRLTEDSFAAVVALAEGRMRCMNLAGARGRVREPALLAAVQANAATLRELHLPRPTIGMNFYLSPGLRQRLELAAPGLLEGRLCVHTLGARHYGIPIADATRMLRCRHIEAQALQMRYQRTDAPAALAALRRAIAKHGGGLRDLDLQDANCACLRVLLRTLVEHNGFKRLTLSSCALRPAALPALAELLRGGTLRNLSLSYEARYGQSTPLFGDDRWEYDDEDDIRRPYDEFWYDDDDEQDEQEMPIAEVSPQVVNRFCAAITAPTCALTTLRLYRVGLWRAPRPLAAFLLDALAGHPRLSELTVWDHEQIVDDGLRAEVGAAFGTLVAANAPALTSLEVQFRLGDEGLAPLFAALPGNTHLRRLDVGGNDLSDDFLYDTALPALRANTSLRAAYVSQGHETPEIVEELEAVKRDIAAREPVV